MVEEDFIRELKLQNEQLAQAVNEIKKNNGKDNSKVDWKNNPILYIAVVAIAAIVINIFQNINNTDYKLLNQKFTIHEEASTILFKSIQKDVNKNSISIEEMAKKVNNINTTVEILKDRGKSEWDKAVEKYNKDNSQRGGKGSRDQTSIINNDCLIPKNNYYINKDLTTN